MDRIYGLYRIAVATVLQDFALNLFPAIGVQTRIGAGADIVQMDQGYGAEDAIRG